MWRNPLNWIWRLFILIFHTGKQKNRPMNIVESVLRGLKDLQGHSDICWSSKCIWSLFNARGSWALSQSFVPVILKTLGFIKHRHMAWPWEQMRKGVCLLSAQQRKPATLRKGIRIFANQQPCFKDLSQSSPSPQNKWHGLQIPELQTRKRESIEFGQTDFVRNRAGP